MSKSVDARGRSCPEPVLMTRDALKSNEKQYEVLVDNRVAVENVTRFASKAGYQTETVARGSDFLLTLSRR